MAKRPDPSKESSTDRPEWMDRHLWHIQPLRDLLTILAIVGVLYLGHVLSIVTVPLLLALVLAYLFEPLVSRMTRVEWISRPGAAMMIIIASVMIVLVPLTLGTTFAVVQGRSLWIDAKVRTTQFVAFVELTKDLGSPRMDDDGDLQFDPIPASSDASSGDVGTSPTETSNERPTDPNEGDESDEQATDAEDVLVPLIEDVIDIGVTEESEGGADAESEPSASRSPEEQARRLFSQQPPIGKQAMLLVSRLVQREGAYADVLDSAQEWLAANKESVADRGKRAALTLLKQFKVLGVLLFSLFLTAFFFFFFSTGYGNVLEFASGIIPEKNKPQILVLASKMDDVIAGFIRGRLMIAGIQSIFFTIAYWIIGVPAPLIIGPIIGVLSIAPYVSLIGIPITIVAMFVSPAGGEEALRAQLWWVLVMPVVVYFAGQALDDYVLTPTIQGRSTDMDTPSILFASIAGGTLAGVYGLLIAIPVAACAKILLREVFWPKFKDWAEGRRKDFLPMEGE